MVDNRIDISKLADLCLKWRGRGQELYSLYRPDAKTAARTYEACAQELTDLIAAHYDAQTEHQQT